MGESLKEPVVVGSMLLELVTVIGRGGREERTEGSSGSAIGARGEGKERIEEESVTASWDKLRDGDL